MPVMTLEQFRASRREVSDINEAIGAEVCIDEAGDPRKGRGYIYNGNTYVEIEPDGRVYLMIENSEWLRDAAELPLLERELYAWALTSGAIDVPRVAQVMENAGRWSVWLSSDATVVELANLMGGLAAGGCKVKAEHVGGGAFALMPMDNETRAPSGEWICAILADPMRPLPSLVAKL